MLGLSFIHSKLKKDSKVQDGVQEYTKRLSRYTKLKNKISENIFVFSTESENRLTSEELAQLINHQMNAGLSELTILHNKTSNFEELIKGRSTYHISICDFDISEELQILLMYEQVYRAFRIINGHTYHK